MDNPFSHRDYHPWLYMGLTFTWTWVLLGIPVLLGLQAQDFPVGILRALAGAGPMLATLFLVLTRLSPAEKIAYRQRLMAFRSIGPRCWLIVLGFVPALTFVAGSLDRLEGGPGVQLEAAARFLEQPLSLVPFALFMLAFGPIPEELGWRGYALPGFQATWSPLVSSLILGVFWALWHLPLFFIPGTYQAGLGILTPAFWWFMLGMIPESVVMTWIFNQSRGSTLSAILFHFSINVTGEMFMLSPQGDVFSFLGWCLAAVLIAVL